SDRRRIAAPRCSGLHCGNGPRSNARRAAATARSTSSRVASGTRPITSSVDAERTSIFCFACEATHSPPMKRSLYSAIATRALLFSTHYTRSISEGLAHRAQLAGYVGPDRRVDDLGDALGLVRRRALAQLCGRARERGGAERGREVAAIAVGELVDV